MKIAAYGRVSTDRDEQLESLENQKLFFADFAARYGHTLVRIYAEACDIIEPTQETA